MAPLELAAELDFAMSLADIADNITLEPFLRRDFTVDWKTNKTEVTELDRRTEEVLVQNIVRNRPDHGIVGEEHGVAGAPNAAFTWVIDPIDGTSNYARGVPVWATLIALVDANDQPILGVVSAPALRERWRAARGIGAFNHRGRLRVSSIDALSEAQVSITPNSGWDAAGGTTGLVKLQQAAYRTRGYGDFWQHMLVAEGAVDAAVDAIGLEPYDTAAIAAVVREAGGTFTDRLGDASYRRGSAVTSNGRIHQSVLDIIRC